MLRSTDMPTRLFKFPLSVCSCRNIAAGRHGLQSSSQATGTGVQQLGDAVKLLCPATARGWFGPYLTHPAGVPLRIAVHQSVSESCRRGDVYAFARVFGIGSSRPSSSDGDISRARGVCPAAMIRDAPCAILCQPTSLHRAQGGVPALFFRCL